MTRGLSNEMLSVIQRRSRLHTSELHAPNVSLVKVSTPLPDLPSHFSQCVTGGPILSTYAVGDNDDASNCWELQMSLILTSGYRNYEPSGARQLVPCEFGR